jgi:hypothetical protein
MIVFRAHKKKQKNNRLLKHTEKKQKKTLIKKNINRTYLYIFRVVKCKRKGKRRVREETTMILLFIE